MCLRILVCYLFDLCQVVLLFFLSLLSFFAESDWAEYYHLLSVYIDSVFTRVKSCLFGCSIKWHCMSIFFTQTILCC